MGHHDWGIQNHRWQYDSLPQFLKDIESSRNPLVPVEGGGGRARRGGQRSSSCSYCSRGRQMGRNKSWSAVRGSKEPATVRQTVLVWRHSSLSLSWLWSQPLCMRHQVLSVCPPLDHLLCEYLFLGWLSTPSRSIPWDADREWWLWEDVNFEDIFTTFPDCYFPEYKLNNKFFLFRIV